MTSFSFIYVQCYQALMMTDTEIIKVFFDQVNLKQLLAQTP